MKKKRRSVSEFARVYGSKERVAFVANLSCVVMLCRITPSENMHIKSDGMGRKADARFIVPACHVHHRQAHRIGIESFADRHFLFLEVEAAKTDKAWDEYRADRLTIAEATRRRRRA